MYPCPSAGPAPRSGMVSRRRRRVPEAVPEPADGNGLARPQADEACPVKPTQRTNMDIDGRKSYLLFNPLINLRSETLTIAAPDAYPPCTATTPATLSRRRRPRAAAPLSAPRHRGACGAGRLATE